jgi:hypothetical protein
MKATHRPPLDTTPQLEFTPAELLRGAAFYLGRHGWTQHQFYDMFADTDGPFPPACASGAIMSAASGRCLGDGTCTIDGGENPETIYAVRAMRVLASWVDLDFTASSYLDTSAIDVIGDWNDDDSRTVGDVIEALQDAADDWDRLHSTGGAR